MRSAGIFHLASQRGGDFEKNPLSSFVALQAEQDNKYQSALV